MPKVVLFIFAFLCTFSFIQAYPIPSLGSGDEMTMTAEAVAMHKEDQQQRMAEATKKYEVAKKNFKKAPFFSLERSIQRAVKTEESHHEKIHRKNISQLDQIPNGGKIHLKTSESGSPPKFRVIKH